MKKRDLNDMELDRIAGLLVRSASVSASEIDKIARDPAMFDKVRARIRAEEGQPTASSRSYGFIRRNAAAVSGVLLISIAAITFGFFRTKTPEIAYVPTVDITEQTKPEIKRFTQPDQAVYPTPIEPSERIVPQRATMSRTTTRTPLRRVPAAVGKGNEFYAVSYAGDPSETERGGRIIRVDMPRSALFAMGVDIPLENEAEVVKADLLVGPDGVTRAIRVVE